MRLICPNCGAQYAVDDRVIPEAGRDVQCSNCGNTWFQVHPDHEPELAAETGFGRSGSAAASARPVSKPAAEPAADVSPSPEPPPAPGLAEEPEPDFASGSPFGPPPGLSRAKTAAEAETAPEAAAGESSELPGLEGEPASASEPSSFPEEPEYEDEDDLRTLPPRRTVHEAAMSVLREEAAREQAVRRSEAGGLETQAELDIPPPASAARSPARVLPSDTLPPETTRVRRTVPRRDRLPDVEEINSSLDPKDSMAARRAHTGPEAMAYNRGRRLGFGLALLVFGAGAIVYAQADRLSSAVPPVEPVLGRYASTVDTGRVWLDRTLREVVASAENTQQ